MLRSLLAYPMIVIGSALVTALLTWGFVSFPNGFVGSLQELMTVNGARAVPVVIWLVASLGGCMLRLDAWPAA